MPVGAVLQRSVRASFALDVGDSYKKILQYYTHSCCRHEIGMWLL